jgi:signal peptidase II
MALNRGHKLTIIAAILLVIDQVSKILVKTNMTIGESISVLGDWFQILFIENPGMAFGMEFGGSIGKYFLTILRIVLVIVMIIYLRKLLKKGSEVPMGVCVGIMMVMVGALGNILDCMFYGILFGESTMMQVAQFLPEGGGYAPFFLGKVVDMLFFPLIDTTWPEWVPFVGGDSLIFFRPIFNFADSCITVGALYLMIFQWKFFSEK